MKRIDSREIAKIGVLSALGVMAISLFRIPGPGGNVYFHLGETVILTAAIVLGRRGGMFVGAFSSAIADILLGAAVWAPISFLIHGVEGWLVGSLSNASGGARDVVAMSVGVAVMILGYTCAAGLLYGPAIMPVEFVGDGMQGLLGVATAYPLSRLLSGRFSRIEKSGA